MCKDIEFKDKCQFLKGIVNVISKRLSCFRVAGLIDKVPTHFCLSKDY